MTTREVATAGDYIQSLKRLVALLESSDQVAHYAVRAQMPSAPMFLNLDVLVHGKDHAQNVIEAAATKAGIRVDRVDALSGFEGVQLDLGTFVLQVAASKELAGVS